MTKSCEEDETIGFEYSTKNGKEDGKWIEW